MADLNHRVGELENEIKVIKNEVKAILLDVREQYLNAENPFLVGAAGAQGNTSTTIINSNPAAQSNSEENTDQSKNSKDNPPDSPSAYNSEQESEGEDEKSTSQNDEKDKKGEKSTLPALTMGPDTGESKTNHGNKGSNKMKTVMGKFLPGDDDDDIPSAGEMQFAKETMHKSGKQNGGKSGNGNGGNINLLTIAALSRWVDESTEKIGKERSEVMVEACYLVGHISNEFKDLLIRLVRLSQAEEPKKGRINTQDYLGVIARLDGLLGYNDGSESALLSILTDNKESHYG